MNLNFIGKEFDSLAKLEDYINYEYEPKANNKLGKRNIYFGDLRLDFVNEINTYGFSPFIFESYSDQINDPNIMRFRTKKFNHGLTNYIKLQTRGIIPHSSGQNKKKNGLKNSKKNLKNSEKMVSNIFLVKKNDDSLKKNDNKNFLQKALVGGFKLNISIDEDENKEKDKEKDESKNKSSRDKKESNTTNINNNKEISSIEDKQLELMQELLGIKNNNKNYLPNILLGSKELSKETSLKVLYDNKGSFKNINNNKKILTLRKNLNLFGDKATNRIFSSINKRKIKKYPSTSDLFSSTKNNNSSDIRSRINKKKGTTRRSKERFLLFEKARPYRYMKESNGS